jgi:hypothetical protein
MLFKKGEKLHNNIYYYKAGDFPGCIQSLEEFIYLNNDSSLKSKIKSFILFVFWVEDISIYHTYLLKVQNLSRLIPIRDYMVIVTKSNLESQIFYSTNEVLELIPLIANANYVVNVDALKFSFVKSWVKNTIKK